MQITRYTGNACRVLRYLAVNNSHRATMAEIARYYTISHADPGKVGHQLSALGYINTLIGKGGSMKPKKAPGNINAGKLLMEFGVSARSSIAIKATDHFEYPAI